MESYTSATAGPTHPVSSGGARNFQLGWGLSPDTWRARGARAASLYGGLEAEPQRGPRADPLVGGQGASPPEAESCRIWEALW